MARYLLTCSCGRDVEVGTGDAGRSLRCLNCGAELDVPTVRGLSALKRISGDEVPRVWGMRQQVLFVGLLIAAGAGAFGLLLEYNRRPVPDLPELLRQIDEVPMADLFYYWHQAQLGIELISQKEIDQLERDLAIKRWSKACFVMAGFGLLMAASSFLFPLVNRSADQHLPDRARRNRR